MHKQGCQKRENPYADCECERIERFELTDALQRNTAEMREQQNWKERAESAEARLAEAEKDKAMLDWVEINKPNIFCICEFGDVLDSENVTGTHWEINHIIEKPLLREAIDDAMKQTT